MFYLVLLLVVIFDVLDDYVWFGVGVVGLVVAVVEVFGVVLVIGAVEGGFLGLVEDVSEGGVLFGGGLFVDVNVGVVLGDVDADGSVLGAE